MKFSGLLPFILISLVGCSEILTRRTFIETMNNRDERFFRPGKDFPIVVGDTTYPYLRREEILKRIPSLKQVKEMSLKEELLSKEAELSEQELIHYKKINEYFTNDSERIFYLSLSTNDRAVYRQHKGAKQKTQKRRKRAVSSVGMRLRPGMSQEDVMKYYGRPKSIEFFGLPQSELEKWTFYHKNTVRYVYFEDGFVRQWSSN